MAAPTAGSAGVVPGVLLALEQERGLDAAALRRGLLAAGAVGYLIARNATVSGAEGGCQAEIGAAAAMAAAAAVEMAGGTPAQALDAAANALSSVSYTHLAGSRQATGAWRSSARSDVTT